MDVEEILKNIGREGDRVAKWWKAVSRIVRQYIVPYIVELEEKVDDNYFKMIEEEKNFYNRYSLLRRVQYSLFEFSRDVLRVIDILLRAVDPEYRSLRDDDVFGELLLVECELMQKIYKYDDRYQDLHILYTKEATGYLIINGSLLLATQNIKEVLRLSKPMIIAGYQSRMNPQLENLLASHGYEYVKRTVDDRGIVILFAKRSDVNLRGVYTSSKWNFREE